jgi:hypothetical protein
MSIRGKGLQIMHLAVGLASSVASIGRKLPFYEFFDF